jgi:hypothetical protein
MACSNTLFNDSFFQINLYFLSHLEQSIAKMLALIQFTYHFFLFLIHQKFTF